MAMRSCTHKQETLHFQDRIGGLDTGQTRNSQRTVLCIHEQILSFVFFDRIRGRKYVFVCFAFASLKLARANARQNQSFTGLRTREISFSNKWCVGHRGSSDLNVTCSRYAHFAGLSVISSCQTFYPEQPQDEYEIHVRSDTFAVLILTENSVLRRAFVAFLDRNLLIGKFTKCFAGIAPLL